MEFVLLAAIVLATAAYVVLPRTADIGDDIAVEPLHQQRRELLQELRELDDDAAAERISGADRLAGRRALGPRLREVTDALRELGEETRRLS
jgi:hypothetical protein